MRFLKKHRAKLVTGKFGLDGELTGAGFRPPAPAGNDGSVFACDASGECDEGERGEVVSEIPLVQVEEESGVRFHLVRPPKCCGYLRHRRFLAGLRGKRAAIDQAGIAGGRSVRQLRSAAGCAFPFAWSE